MNQARIAILIDGGFFLKRLPRLVSPKHCNSPDRTVACIRSLCRTHIKTLTGDNDSRWHRYVYRIFFFDAVPYDGKAHHPIDNRRCPPWRAKRRRVVPGSREATRDTRRAEGAKGDPKGASERGVQSYGRPVCSRNELAMLWRNAG